MIQTPKPDPMLATGTRDDRRFSMALPQGVGDVSDAEPLAIDDIDHGQADPVDGDEALGDHVGQQRRGGAEMDDAGLALRCQGQDAACPFDMPLNEMPAHTRGRCQGPFQVDPITDGQSTQIAASEGLRNGIDGEGVAAWPLGHQGGRQADAVDGDAVAHLQVYAAERCVDTQDDQLTPSLKRPYPTDFFDDAGKHASTARCK